MAHADALVPASIHRSHLAPLRRDLAAGALAGQVAGLVMAAAVMAVFTLFLGKGPLFPVQLIGSLLYGDAALAGFHPGALLAGLLLHQAGPSLAWGLAFGALVHGLGLRRGGLLLAAALTGLASQVVDAGLLVPAAMRALHGHDLWAENVPAFWGWAAHLIFGLALACQPWIARRLGPAGPDRPTGDA